MNKQRRLFIGQVALMAGATALSKPMEAAASASQHINTLYSGDREISIYHTNDLQGNFDPVIGGMGGIKQLKKMLKAQETRGLLLDAGGFLNGSANSAQHKEVIGDMNSIGYHVAGIGANELAQGQDALGSLIPLMQFSLVNCNYDFDASLAQSVKQYVIIKSGKFRVGVTGIGPKIAGVRYHDAIAEANSVAHFLKNTEKCNLVVCLSRLPHATKDDQPDNTKLAKQSENIDMIVSSHGTKLLSGTGVLLK